MDTDAVFRLFMDALAALPYPVSQTPAGGSHETYLVFNEVGGDFAQPASGQSRRTKHLVQLHAFSTREDGEHRRAFFEAIYALRGAGVRVQSWGPDTYENDTGKHHIAATCSVWIRPTEREMEE